MKIHICKSISTKVIYKNQGLITICHSPFTSDLNFTRLKFCKRF